MGRQPVGGIVRRTTCASTWRPSSTTSGLGPQTNSELIITVAPGQTRFLLAQLTPSGGAELLELSQEQGRKLARQGSAYARRKSTRVDRSRCHLPVRAPLQSPLFAHHAVR